MSSFWETTSTFRQTGVRGFDLVSCEIFESRRELLSQSLLPAFDLAPWDKGSVDEVRSKFEITFKARIAENPNAFFAIEILETQFPLGCICIQI